MIHLHPRKRVFLMLWLMSIHSFGVALGLMFLPTKLLPLFGFYGYSGRFFQIQSGVFHVVMAAAYLMAAYQTERSPGLVQFSIYAKTIAFAFLITIYFFYTAGWMVLFSALADGLMALILYLLYREYRTRI